MKNQKSIIIALSVLGVILGLHVLQVKTSVAPEWVMQMIRIVGILYFVYYAWQSKKLPTWILVSMLIGIEIGYDLPELAVKLDVLSKVFLKLIKTIIAPLIFATLVVGIAGHSNLKQVGRIAWKSILYFYAATTAALFIGLAAINLTHAGSGITLPADINQEMPSVPKQSWQEMILHIFPENIAKSIAEGQVLQVVIFSIIFGIALAMLNERMKRPMLEFSESLAETMFKFTNIVMYFAPIGVGGAIAYTVGKMGIGVLLHGIYLVLTLYGALLAFILLVLLPIAFLRSSI